MGEIRSTLDIIMEKARDVEVTDEDKAAFLKRDVEGKIKGFVQKALDGFIDAEGLHSEIRALARDRYEVALSVLKSECLSRMAPDADNRELLEILSRVAGFDTSPVEKLLLEYGKEREEKRAAREAALRQQLTDQGISGSAVNPNLKADPEWINESTEAKDRFHQALEGLNRES